LILSIVSGSLIWLILRKKSIRFRNKVIIFCIFIIIPITIISFLSTILRIGFYQISISLYDFYIPLSYPFEITKSQGSGLFIPQTFVYYIKIFGYRIHLFDIVDVNYGKAVLAFHFVGFFLLLLNYLSTCLTLFSIKKIITYYRRNKE